MNSKKFTEAMSKIDNKYVGEALFYNGTRLGKKSSKRIAALFAAIIAVLGLCGFAAYEIGLFDPWLQKPSAEPIETVRSAIEGRLTRNIQLPCALRK